MSIYFYSEWNDYEISVFQNIDTGRHSCRNLELLRKRSDSRFRVKEIIEQHKHSNSAKYCRERAKLFLPARYKLLRHRPDNHDRKRRFRESHRDIQHVNRRHHVAFGRYHSHQSGPKQTPHSLADGSLQKFDCR